MRARGSLGLLGPSTRRALAALPAGASIEDAGRSGTTNGAAMRIAPVGVATPSGDPGLLVDRVVAASRVTHNTGVALAGAAAVAAAVSAGIDGAAVPEAIRRRGRRGGRAPPRRGHWAAAADVAARDHLGGRPGRGARPGAGASTLVYRLVGTSLATQESVPAAFAVAAASPDDPWLACRIAASLGGDCDTIAAMTGAICGACHGAEAFPEAARSTVTRVNGAIWGWRGWPPACWRCGPGRLRERVAMRQAEAGPGRFDRLLHLGNVVVDVVLDVPALPERGGDVLASRAAATAGGGFNVMAAAARQGLRAAYGGRARHRPVRPPGPGRAGGGGHRGLQPPKAGLDTGFVLTMVEAGGERTFLTSRGAEATLTAADLDRVSPAARDAVYLSGYGLAHDSNRAALLGWLARLGAAASWCSSTPARWWGPSRPPRWPPCSAGPTGWPATRGRPPSSPAARTRGRRRPRWPRRAGPAGRPRVLVRTGPGGCLLARPGAGVRAGARVPGGRGGHQRRGRRPQRRVHRGAGGGRGRHRRRAQRERGRRALGHPARAGHGADPGGTGPVSRHRLKLLCRESWYLADCSDARGQSCGTCSPARSLRSARCRSVPAGGSRSRS